MAGGGSLMDIGIYALNAARYRHRRGAGRGQRDDALDAERSRASRRSRRTINFQLRFPSGILANCSSSYGVNLQPHPRRRSRADRPSSSRRPATPACACGSCTGGAVEERILPQRDHFATEMDHFAECVLDNTEPLTPGEEGLKDLKVMMAIYEAARSGKTIKLA